MGQPEDLIAFLTSGTPIPPLPPEPGASFGPTVGQPTPSGTPAPSVPSDDPSLFDGSSLLTRGLGGSVASFLLRGRGFAVTVPPRPRTLVGAIVRRVRETPSLAGRLAGGVGAGIARPGTPMPYARLFQITAVPQRNTGRGYLEDTLVQVDLFATTEAELADIRAAWEASFHPKMVPLPLRDGYVTGLYTGNDRPAPDDGLQPGATRSHRWTFEIRALVGRNPPAS